MQDIKTYFPVAHVLTTLWFGSLAGLLIEMNRCGIIDVVEDVG